VNLAGRPSTFMERLAGDRDPSLGSAQNDSVEIRVSSHVVTCLASERFSHHAPSLRPHHQIRPKAKKSPAHFTGRGRAALGETYFGISTVSMTWMTPLEHMMSALVTVASLIMTVPPCVLILSDSPLTVFAEFTFMA
jgi:hypothetical protein